MMEPPRTRRRGAELEEAILDAALAEIREVGYALMTVEGVARRAGAGKYSLYKRWPTKVALAVAAAYRLNLLNSPSSTGDLREDLFLWLRRTADVMDGPAGQIYRGVLAEALAPTLHPALGPLSRKKGDAELRHILLAARNRGEPIPNDLPELVMQAPQALLRVHFLTHGTPIHDELLRGIVDEVALPLLVEARL